MRPLAVFAALMQVGLSPVAFAQGDADEKVSVQRYLVNLYLGDTLDQIQKLYPPAQEWPASIEPRAHVKRYRVERTYIKSPIPSVDTMWLGLRNGRLAEIELIYTARFTRDKSVEAMAADLELIYGEPHSSGGKFWWTDGRTVLRVFHAEVPVLKDGGQGVELRTSLQLLEGNLFRGNRT